jgi:hypothetical protein
MNFRKSYLLLLLLLTQFTFSQEGVPVYSDYLTDNYYLLHPSMAGAANCAKLRLTGRQQWFGQEDAPSFQTLSFNGRLTDRGGAGIILLNDRNGYHSQKGLQLTYAHHIMFSRDEIDLNQLSFGISAGFVQSLLDETDFINSGDYDPQVDGTIVQKASYFNVDIGASYNYLDFYAHVTVKNEKSVDINLKAYKELDFGRLWGGLSYRRSLDGAQFVDGNSVTDQKLQYITPLIGVNYKNFMVAYTYSALLGDVKFDNGGFHQITLGMNLFCQPDKYECNCPAISSIVSVPIRRDFFFKVC